jgi:dienelactone hydrolase
MTRASLALLLLATVIACSEDAARRAESTSTAAATSGAENAAPPTLAEACGDGNGDLNARSFWQETSDGVRLYMIEAGEGSTTAVLAHGGRSDLCDTLDFARQLLAAGYRIVAFDFRGNGRSASPLKNALALGKDLAAAVAYARASGAERVFLIGSSMGGAAIVQNTAALRVDGRISLSGTRLWPGFGINHYASLRRIRDPFLYVGSRNDWRAPLKEALDIFRSVGAADKRHAFYPGSDHGWGLLGDTGLGARAQRLVLQWIESHS